MFTGIFSDVEGWIVTNTSTTREDIVEWFEENDINISEGGYDLDGWNPSPMIICGNDHSIETFDGFTY